MRAGIVIAAMLLSACGSAVAPGGKTGTQAPPLQTFIPDDILDEDFAAPDHDPVACVFQVPWPGAPDYSDVLNATVTRAIFRVKGQRHVLLPDGDGPPNLAGVPDTFANTSYSARFTQLAQQPEPDSLGNQVTLARLTLRDAWGREVYAADGALVCVNGD